MNGGVAKDEKFNSLSLKAHYVSLSLPAYVAVSCLPFVSGNQLHGGLGLGSEFDIILF